LEQKPFNIHQDIIDRCLAGNRLAQYELYKLYCKSMYNVSYRILKNSGDAEDVLQEAFVSVFKNLYRYEGTATFGVWLKRIVINKSLNLLKKCQPDLLITESLPDVIDNASEDDNNVDSFTVDRVKRAIELLPDGYRMVFSLYLLEGYDHGEIADILGISESTSKSQFNRSKKKLREILEQEVSYE
jgi:RNA polymerase sigma factor (sigma-70 family)